MQRSLAGRRFTPTLQASNRTSLFDKRSLEVDPYVRDPSLRILSEWG